MNKDTALILLAGGTGSRMNSSIPKQFMDLRGKPVVLYSLEIFLADEDIKEIVIVCCPTQRDLFSSLATTKTIRFAIPGERRQDSVFNGLQAIRTKPALVCIHDSARPLINSALVKRVIGEASVHGAATTGMPVKFTVKESSHGNFVKATLDRSKLWEIQTPQVIQYDLLQEAFVKINEENITITDDVSAVEWLNRPVKLIEGDFCNIKITTPEDLVIADQMLEKLGKTL